METPVLANNPVFLIGDMMQFQESPLKLDGHLEDYFNDSMSFMAGKSTDPLVEKIGRMLYK